MSALMHRDNMKANKTLLRMRIVYTDFIHSIYHMHKHTPRAINIARGVVVFISFISLFAYSPEWFQRVHSQFLKSGRIYPCRTILGYLGLRGLCSNRHDSPLARPTSVRCMKNLFHSGPVASNTCFPLTNFVPLHITFA